MSVELLSGAVSSVPSEAATSAAPEINLEPGFFARMQTNAQWVWDKGLENVKIAGGEIQGLMGRVYSAVCGFFASASSWVKDRYNGTVEYFWPTPVVPADELKPSLSTKKEISVESAVVEASVVSADTASSSATSQGFCVIL